MKRWVQSSEDIMCMSNVVGKYTTVEDIPFSFYYSVRNGNHGPRVKVTMNSENMRPHRMSVLKLCDDWSIQINSEDGKISARNIALMKKFFKKYIVLFVIIWEDLAPEPSLGWFMEGRINLDEFIRKTDFYSDYKEDLDKITNISDFENYCRKHNLVNFYGN